MGAKMIERHTAEKLLQLADEVTQKLSEAVDVVHEQTTTPEQSRYLAAYGAIMNDMLEKIIEPTLESFPELRKIYRDGLFDFDKNEDGV